MVTEVHVQSLIINIDQSKILTYQWGVEGKVLTTMKEEMRTGQT